MRIGEVVGLIGNPIVQRGRCGLSEPALGVLELGWAEAENPIAGLLRSGKSARPVGYYRTYQTAHNTASPIAH